MQHDLSSSKSWFAEDRVQMNRRFWFLLLAEAELQTGVQTTHKVKQQMFSVLRASFEDLLGFTFVTMIHGSRSSLSFHLSF